MKTVIFNCSAITSPALVYEFAIHVLCTCKFAYRCMFANLLSKKL